MNGDWRTRAACGGTDPHLWFGPDDEPALEQRTREARAIDICRPCPVRLRCLDDALAEPSQRGVRGGMGEKRRKALRHAALKRQQRQEGRAA